MGEFYEARAVAFLDILGFEQRVRESVGVSSASPLHRVMDFASAIDGMKRPVDAIHDFTIFSDSIVISSRTLDDLLSEVSGIWKIYAADGFFLRGGITFGDLIHRGRLVYGPALIDAYQLESQIASVPRLIIDPAIETRASTLPALPGDICRRVLLRDSDGMVYLNTLATFADIEPFAPPAWLEPIRLHIEDGLRCNISKPGVLAKFRWLALRFNEHAERYPWLANPVDSGLMAGSFP